MNTIKRLRLAAASLALLVVLGAAPIAFADDEDPPSNPAVQIDTKAAAHEISHKPVPGDAPLSVLLEGAELGGIVLVCLFAFLHDRHLRRQRLMAAK